MTQFPTRYPGYDVLEKAATADWDEQTWQAVQDRINIDRSPRFFTARETEILESVVERIIPQPDRPESERVPIVSWIDEKLFYDRRDGYRYEGMPAQRDAWRLAVDGIEQTARAIHGHSFTELSRDLQDAVLHSIEEGNPPGDAWRQISAKLFFKSMLCITVVKAFYSHPSAWNEIGYSGPSSPRGHVRIWIGGVDMWEPHERPTLWGTE